MVLVLEQKLNKDSIHALVGKAEEDPTMSHGTYHGMGEIISKRGKIENTPVSFWRNGAGSSRSSHVHFLVPINQAVEDGIVGNKTLANSHLVLSLGVETFRDGQVTGGIVCATDPFDSGDESEGANFDHEKVRAEALRFYGMALGHYDLTA